MELYKLIKCFLSIILILLSACSGGGGTSGSGVISTEKVSVEGVLRDQNGLPVSNASIQVAGESQTHQTDEQGNFSFDTEKTNADFDLRIVKDDIQTIFTVEASSIVDDRANLTIIIAVSPTPSTGSQERLCNNNLDCDSSEYCDHPELSCGTSGSFGACRNRSESLVFCADPNANEPVCGCDGNRYDNECNAISSGVSVTASQDCLNEGIPINEAANCAPEVAGSRPSGSYCKPLLAQCISNNPNTAILGFCEALPTSCGIGENPVCGCDGATYANECSALKAGLAVARQGAC